MKEDDYSSVIKGGLTMLRDAGFRLPPSERKIAAYILRHPEESVRLTAQELGRKSGTSSAAVIRLCKSLNLKGFPDLKLRVTGDLQKSAHDGYREIERNEPYSSVVQKMLSNSVKALNETVDTINEDQLKKAVQLIMNSDRIYIFGVGASHLIAVDAEQKFIRINYEASAFSDPHMAATRLANASNSDLFFAISFSGETKEVIRLINIAKQQKTAVLSLTRFGHSSLSQASDCTLFTSASMEPTLRSGATSSRMVQLFMIDILFMCVVADSYDQSIQYIEQTRRAIQQMQKE
ncbi:MurR/RpiR family transcriptional regulator [Alteribacillus sp. HJP-4]|uniref:MurR/RpiR family transcriptional regulator n=1 Tax=Alteribacillus sp. HJP-4 TaxID=2775394 RepID=UPI0035CCEC91